MCDLALSRERIYRAGCNFFWLNLHRSLMPGVPLSIHRIRHVVDSYWKDPKPFVGMVAVEAKADGGLPRENNLLMLSAEENAHIFLLAIDACITRGEDEEIIKKWHHYALSVCFEYHDLSHLGPDAAYWWAWNHREQICLTTDALKRTAVQRACEVSAFKANLDKTKQPSTVDTIAKAYTDGAVHKKDYGVPFVRECLSVYDKICCNKDIMKILDNLEKKFGIDSCLNSMSKLQKVLEKCDSTQQRILVFTAIEDSITYNILPNTKFTREFLTGGAKDNGSSIPFVALVIFKWRIREQLLSIEMPKEKLDPKDLRVIAEKTDSYAKYRLELDEGADTTWIGAMQPSSALALRLLQERVMFTH